MSLEGPPPHFATFQHGSLGRVDLTRAGGERFEGKPATQYWLTAAVKGLVVRVNARRVYWGDKGAIPGGPAFENFELVAPFSAGQEFVFGATPDPPEKLGLKAR